LRSIWLAGIIPFTGGIDSFDDKYEFGDVIDELVLGKTLR
jgi:hypothetical protein